MVKTPTASPTRPTEPAVHFKVHVTFYNSPSTVQCNIHHLEFIIQEEELRKEGGKFSHLSDELHVQIEAHAEPSEAHSRIAHALAELKKFLIPVSTSLLFLMQWSRVTT